MGVPATAGQLRTKVSDMQIGDYIACRYQASSGVAGTFSELGTCAAVEIPVIGSKTPDGLFYLMKADKGLLIADRVVQHSVSWDTLNAAGYIQGKAVTLDGEQRLVRSLTGGCAYADANGNPITTDQGLGAAPTNNEWDTYIVKSDLGGNITAGNYNVWNSEAANRPASWATDTPITAILPNYFRVARGRNTARSMIITSSDQASSSYGFRPVFEYDEEGGSLWQ